MSALASARTGAGLRRRLPASERARWALVVGAGVLALVALSAWWIEHYRNGYPFDVDEAGYTTIALIDHLGLQTGGLHGWWHAIQTQTPNAPLVPALTSLVFVLKTGTLEGFAVELAFLVLLAFAVYGIGERLAGPRLGALAALVTAASPGAFGFAREYVFALPTAALLACAVYALLRSDGLQRRRWALVAGAALGLMLLTRTMAIAFVPGVLAAAVVAIAARPERPRGRAFVNLALVLVAGAAVAALWYAHNLSQVVDYLTNFGYGSKSAEYGARLSLFSWDRWRLVAHTLINEALYLPLALLLFAGVAAVAVLGARGVARAADRRAALLALARTDALCVAIVLVAGYAALTSSRNIGNGFAFPLTVVLAPLAVLALRHLPRARTPAVVALALVSALTVLSNSNVSDGLTRVRTLSVPLLGEPALPVLGGVPRAVVAIRDQLPGPSMRFATPDRGWPRADVTVARFIVQHPGLGTFSMRNRVISTNSVGLAGALDFHQILPLTQLTADHGDTEAAYRSALSALPPVTLVTMDTEAGDFLPHVTQAKVAAAARALGFHVAQTLALPDGRHLRIWGRAA